MAAAVPPHQRKRLRDILAGGSDMPPEDDQALREAMRQIDEGMRIMKDILGIEDDSGEEAEAGPQS